MFCSTCGNALTEGATTCPTCGAQVSPAAVQTRSPGRPVPVGTPSIDPITGTRVPGATMAPSQNSTAAIVSLSAGIASWTIFIFIPFIGALVAIIAGHMAKKEIRESGNRIGGDGLATAGLIMGYAHMVLSCLAIAGLIAFMAGVLALGANAR